MNIAATPTRRSWSAKLALAAEPAWSHYQQAIFDWVLNGTGNLRVGAVAGSGKCLGRGTRVLMHDGSVKLVEDILVGDLLMGQDSSPRTVLSVCSGVDELFEIIPVKGDPWICNSCHILTLVCSKCKCRMPDGSLVMPGDVIDIPLDVFLSMPEGHQARFKLIRTGVDFAASSELPYDPYFCGLWLGDGTSDLRKFSVCDQNESVLNYLQSYANQLGYRVRLDVNSATTVHFVAKTNDGKMIFPGWGRNRNELMDYFREHFVVEVDGKNHKKIPHHYLTASRSDRLKMLGGLLDTDGYYHCGYYEIITKFDSLNADILYLARSLGFAAYSSRKTASIKSIGFSGEYWRITISGDVDQIPSLYRNPEPRQQCKSVLRTGFSVESVGSGDYFGFELDGDGRFLLGDFTVTHNTTVLSAIVARLPASDKAQILAFNKHIVDSLKQGTHANGCPKVPTRVTVSTAHSMGCALVNRTFANPADMDGYKYNKLAKAAIVAKFGQLPRSATRQAKALQKDQIAFLVAMIRGVQSTLCTPSEARLKELVGYFNLDVSSAGAETIIAMVSGCIDKGIAMARDEQVIDFGDMLYLPHVWGLKPVAKDWVLVDEVQDANNAQLSLYGKLAANGRAIFVGDADQAIQGFAFASPAMWGKIESKFNTTDLPLSVCYRCPVSHLDLARYFVPQIEAAPGAIQGEIATVHPEAVVEQVQSGDLILCRFTAPLLDLCIKLIIKGIPAKVRGKDLGKQLVAVADIGEECWDNYHGNFADSMAAKIAEAEEAEKQEQVDRLTDHCEAILAIYRAFGQDCRSLSEFLIGIEELFSDEASPVTLSTIHRAKGDEADRVWILAANMMPYARDGMVDWQLKQENNLAYVALTRAKKAMFFVPTEDRDRSIDQLIQPPYAGFAVSPVPARVGSIPDVAPYPVGSMFSWLGNPGYEITAVELHDGQWRYKAKYVGSSYHWACDWYDHHLLGNVKVLEDCQDDNILV